MAAGIIKRYQGVIDANLQLSPHAVVPWVTTPLSAEDRAWLSHHTPRDLASAPESTWQSLVEDIAVQVISGVAVSALQAKITAWKGASSAAPGPTEPKPASAEAAAAFPEFIEPGLISTEFELPSLSERFAEELTLTVLPPEVRGREVRHEFSLVRGGEVRQVLKETLTPLIQSHLERRVETAIRRHLPSRIQLESLIVRVDARIAASAHRVTLTPRTLKALDRETRQRMLRTAKREIQILQAATRAATSITIGAGVDIAGGARVDEAVVGAAGSAAIESALDALMHTAGKAIGTYAPKIGETLLKYGSSCVSVAMLLLESDSLGEPPEMMDPPIVRD